MTTVSRDSLYRMRNYSFLTFDLVAMPCDVDAVGDAVLSLLDMPSEVDGVGSAVVCFFFPSEVFRSDLSSLWRKSTNIKGIFSHFVGLGKNQGTPFEKMI